MGTREWVGGDGVFPPSPPLYAVIFPPDENLSCITYTRRDRTGKGCYDDKVAWRE